MNSGLGGLDNPLARAPRTQDQSDVQFKGGARWTRAVRDHPGRPLICPDSVGEGRVAGRYSLLHSDRLLTLIDGESSLSPYSPIVWSWVMPAIRPMRYTDIKRYLKPYGIYKERRTTINHAFASAVAPHDEFDDAKVREAMVDLGQDPEGDLFCVYCGAEAQTWDHVSAIVKGGKFSGAGHRIGNLLPSCKTCNSKKGKKLWQESLPSKPLMDSEKKTRKARIRRYRSKYFRRDPRPFRLPEYKKLMTILDQIMKKMQKADDLAASVRQKMQKRKRNKKG